MKTRTHGLNENEWDKKYPSIIKSWDKTGMNLQLSSNILQR